MEEKVPFWGYFRIVLPYLLVLVSIILVAGLVKILSSENNSPKEYLSIDEMYDAGLFEPPSPEEEERLYVEWKLEHAERPQYYSVPSVEEIEKSKQKWDEIIKAEEEARAKTQ